MCVGVVIADSDCTVLLDCWFVVHWSVFVCLFDWLALFVRVCSFVCPFMSIVCGMGPRLWLWCLFLWLLLLLPPFRG